jgi:hypothetical protein
MKTLKFTLFTIICLISSSLWANQCPDASQIGFSSIDPLLITVPAGWKIIDQPSQEDANANIRPNSTAFFGGVDTKESKKFSTSKYKINVCMYFFISKEDLISDEVSIRPTNEEVRTTTYSNLVTRPNWKINEGIFNLEKAWFYCPSINPAECAW